HEGNDDIGLEHNEPAPDSQDTAEQIPDPVQERGRCPSNFHAHPAHAFRALVVIRVITHQGQQSDISTLFHKVATQVSGNPLCPAASKRCTNHCHTTHALALLAHNTSHSRNF